MVFSFMTEKRETFNVDLCWMFVPFEPFVVQINIFLLIPLALSIVHEQIKQREERKERRKEKGRKRKRKGEVYVSANNPSSVYDFKR